MVGGPILVRARPASIGRATYFLADLRAELTGHYLFADFCQAWVRSVRMTGAFASERATWRTLTAPGVVSFGRDGADELYLVGDGRVWRIVRR